jgi:hypothetical protein
MTSLGKKKSPKITNVPSESVSPIKENLKRSKSQEEDLELIELFSSKWIEVKKLKEIEIESGRVYKRGKFSKQEEETVRSKVSEYLSINNISETEFKEDFFNQKGRKQFKKLFVEVAKSLPQGRPVVMVYHYMRRIYHPGNKQGSWLPEEDLHLKRLFAIHGPQWEIISSELGRFNHSCRDRYRWIREQFGKGIWSKDEIDRLREAIEARKKLVVDHTLGAWAWISEQVKTRSWHQCLTKWTNSISFKDKHPNQKCVRWTKEQDLILLNRIYDLAVEDESEIVWNRLIDESWNVWTPMRLKLRWKLLRRRVRNEKILDMDAIIEALINSIKVLSPSKHKSSSSSSGNTECG